jgi:hypothetical protein
MVRGTLVFAVLAAAFVVSQAATAAPTPAFFANCTQGENTTASWTRYRPATVEFTWSNGADTMTVTKTVPRGGAPTGALSVPSPQVANSVRVNFTGNGGGRSRCPARSPRQEPRSG